MKKSILLLFVLALLPLSGNAANPARFKKGKALPAWRQGWLDIHSINNGRGESFLYIFPDGTTMLVDASGSEPEELVPLDPPGVPSKPSCEYSAGEVINRYLDHYLPKVSGGGLDYFVLSHFHGDHMGLLPSDRSKRVLHPEGGFVEVSLTEVGEAHPFRKVIDRGDFGNRPSATWFSKSGQERNQNYQKFLAWSGSKYGTSHEALQVGRDDQIRLVHKPAKYPGFSVRNIAAGGNVWTGKGYDVDSTYVPSAAECMAYGNAKTLKLKKGMPKINENIFSCVFQLRYGIFDWYSGGDVQHKHKEDVSWFDMELPISKVVRPVDAQKMSHHGTLGANSPEICRALRPNVAIASAWRDVQPNANTLKCFIEANPDVKLIATNMTAHNAGILAAKGVDMSRFIATGGHVVIRVHPHGDRYWVLILDDGDFGYRVKEVFGPYACTD